MYRGRGGTVSSNGLSSRHIKSFKTYGLSKCSEDICDEVDLLLCRGSELNMFFFSLLTTIKSINDREFRRAISQYLSDTSANASGSILFCKST